MTSRDASPRNRVDRGTSTARQEEGDENGTDGEKRRERE
jgi:hypothetical protein